MLGRSRVRTLPRPVLALAALAQEWSARLRRSSPDVSRAAITYVSRRAAYPNARARAVLGWEPRVGLAEGMARTEAWLRSAGHLG
jgi:nucleoside-diphosphate-sugar epimerase